jgi:mRNA interferase RelE/StbE
MKNVAYTADALKALRKHRNEADSILTKVARYAETGAGDVTKLVGETSKRLRVGNFRVIFEETESQITVTKIGPRGSVYD